MRRSIVLALLLISCCVVRVLAQSGSFGSSQGITRPLPTGGAAGNYLQAQNNLSDVGSAAASRSSLGLGTAALCNAPLLGAVDCFGTLEQTVLHALPTVTGPTTLSCTGTAGLFPYDDFWSGTLSGHSTNYVLPASGCTDGSVITIRAAQDGNHTISVTTTAAGGIQGTQLWDIGLVAGNQWVVQYVWDNDNATWIALSVTTVPVQPLPLEAGGTECAGAGLFAALPGSPANGAICDVTDAPACTTGVAVTAGGGTKDCQVAYVGGAWMPAGGAGPPAIAAATPIANLPTCVPTPPVVQPWASVNNQDGSAAAWGATPLATPSNGIIAGVHCGPNATATWGWRIFSQ